MAGIAARFRIALYSVHIMLRQAGLCAALLLTAPLFAQQPEAARPPAIAPHARLTAARTIFIEHSGGSIPNDVIGQAFEGW